MILVCQPFDLLQLLGQKGKASVQIAITIGLNGPAQVLIDIDEQVKALLTREKLTMKELVQQLHDRFGRSVSSANFSNKLSRNTIRYEEAQEIADVLGYEIVWQKKANR